MFFRLLARRPNTSRSGPMVTMVELPMLVLFARVIHVADAFLRYSLAI